MEQKAPEKEVPVKKAKKTPAKETPVKKVKKAKLAFDGKLFAADILEKRTKDDLNFIAAAKQSGASSAALYRCEAKAGAPSMEVFAKICTWLNKPVSRYF